MREVKGGEAESYWRTPSRIVLAVSSDADRKANIITLGWKMFTSFNPRMIAISVGKTRYSHDLIVNSGEFVLAVPGDDLAEAVLYCGTHSGRNVNKFLETGLTPMKGKFVHSPLIEECLANLECRVVGSLETGDHTIFVGEILTSWRSDKRRPNLLGIGDESGYQYILEDHGYRFGVIQK